MVKPYEPPADGQFSKILVPTVDVVRSTWLLNIVVTAGRPCLLVGESGTAKTVTIQNYLSSLDANTNLLLNINFSSRTSSMDVQCAIEVSHFFAQLIKGTHDKNDRVCRSVKCYRVKRKPEMLVSQQIKSL